jgi:hopanoid biosynthesis associated protein HpnK
MVAAPAAADAVARARRLPDLHVGLHLVLVDGRPALPPEQIPDLVDARGDFRTDMARMGLDLALKSSVRRQLAAEIRAQFEAFSATGLPLDHVNAHKHFHLHPIIAAEMIRIGREYGLRAIRVPREPVDIIDAIEPGAAGLGGRALALWTWILRAQARRAGLGVPDAVFGLAWSGAMTSGRVARILAQLPPGFVEIYFHPATGNDFAGHAPGYRYAEELVALTDPGCITAARACGHRMAGYSNRLTNGHG